jgi:uridylate kinase
MKDSDAEKFDFLTYDDVLQKNLEVMDLTAICLCRDHKMPLMVFDMEQKDVLVDIVQGKKIGTTIGVNIND